MCPQDTSILSILHFKRRCASATYLLASPLSHTLKKIDSEVAAVGQCTYIPRDGVSGVETNDSPARRRWRHEEVMASEYERS